MIRGQSTVTQRAAAGVFRAEKPRAHRTAENAEPARTAPATPLLTRRQVQVLAELQRRMLEEQPITMRAIAAALRISESTLVKHCSELRSRLNRPGMFALQAFAGTTKCALLLEHCRRAHGLVDSIRANPPALPPT